jgi:DNA invertase Pin-like site-specific DNA recombinase
MGGCLSPHTPRHTCFTQTEPALCGIRLSLELLTLRGYCAKQGWEIAGEYVDHETGGTSKRPHFQRMFADARQRKFDLVLFWSLDRLSREGVSATLNHLERLTAAGVEWRSFTEQYLDSCGLFRDAVFVHPGHHC